jgi:hypothetical protein
VPSAVGLLPVLTTVQHDAVQGLYDWLATDGMGWTASRRPAGRRTGARPRWCRRARGRRGSLLLLVIDAMASGLARAILRSAPRKLWLRAAFVEMMSSCTRAVASVGVGWGHAVPVAVAGCDAHRTSTVPDTAHGENGAWRGTDLEEFSSDKWS